MKRALMLCFGCRLPRMEPISIDCVTFSMNLRRFAKTHLIMVETRSLATVLLTLFVLGTATSAIGSIFVTLVLRTEAFNWVILGVTVVLAVVFLVLALHNNDSQLSKNILWFLAVIELIVAVATPLIPYQFHDDSGYLNRVGVYFIQLVALIAGLAALWRFITAPIIGEILESIGVDKAQESLLYVLWGVLEAFIVSWLLPIEQFYQRSVMFHEAVHYTVGFYFVGGVLAAVFGLIVVLKGSGGGGGASTTPVAAAAPKGSEYDNVG
jgi:hypothetical protein